MKKNKLIAFGYGGFMKAFMGSILTDSESELQVQPIARKRDPRHDPAPDGSFPVRISGALNGDDASREVSVTHFAAPIFAVDDWQGCIGALLSDDIVAITSNTSEKGFDIDADLTNPPDFQAGTVPPATHPGRFLVMMLRRMNEDLPPLPYYPLELHEDNAAAFRDAATNLLAAWAAADPIDWGFYRQPLFDYIFTKGKVISSLVDQIVPGYVEGALTAEPYRELVFAAPAAEGFVHLDGVTNYVEDHKPYARRKLAGLNLMHVVIVDYALRNRPSWNFETTYVYQAMHDAALVGWLDDFFAEEIAPAIEGHVPGNPLRYWEQVKERFANPALPFTLKKLYGSPEIFKTKFLQRGVFVRQLFEERFKKTPVKLGRILDERTA